MVWTKASYRRRKRIGPQLHVGRLLQGAYILPWNYFCRREPIRVEECKIYQVLWIDKCYIITINFNSKYSSIYFEFWLRRIPKSLHMYKLFSLHYFFFRFHCICERKFLLCLLNSILNQSSEYGICNGVAVLNSYFMSRKVFCYDKVIPESPCLMYGRWVEWKKNYYTAKTIVFSSRILRNLTAKVILIFVCNKVILILSICFLVVTNLRAYA